MDFIKKFTEGDANNNAQQQYGTPHQQSNQYQGQGDAQPQQSYNSSQDGLGGLIGNFAGNQQRTNQQNQTQQGSSSGGFLGGLGDKFNSAAGGGKESEKNEDLLDKGIDFVQEKFLGQGKQDNESAVEQAKDEQISDYIRKQYKSTTGKDFPIKDKKTIFG